MLAIEGLEASYGSIAALRGVSIAVEAGETVAVIGPNGAGKSTLLLAIAGVVKPAGGTIRFEGQRHRRRAAGGAGRRRDRARSRRAAHLRLADGRREPRIGATVRRDAAAVAGDLAHVLELFPDSARAEQPESRQALGRRAADAGHRAARCSPRPRLLLLDEPSLGLAPLVVAQVYETIARLKQEGLTVLLVEQNMHRALAASDRAYVLNSGRVALSGKSSELGQAEEFEAAYFGLKRGGGAP